MSEFESIQMSKMREMERYRNAERLAKALRPYLATANEEISKTRGRIKDKRICQLSAAYKYVVFLEKSLKELCEKTNEQLTDDCRLLHNSVTYLGQKDIDLIAETPLVKYRPDDFNMDFESEPFTPTRNHIIHESSTLSATTTTTTTNQLAHNPFRQLTNLRNFEHVNASPIMGSQSHYINDNVEFNEIKQRGAKRRLLENNKANNNNNNNNETDENCMQTDLNNNNVSKLDDDLDKENSDEPENNNGRKTYFLRATSSRLKYSQPNELKINKTFKREMMKKSSKLQTSTASSTTPSSSSTTTTTTPTLQSSKTCETISNASNDDLIDIVDSQHLLKFSITQSQIANLFDMNKEIQKENKNSFDYV